MKNILKICLLYLLHSIPCVAQQDTVTQYLDASKKICAEGDACYIRSAKKIDGGWIVKDFYWNERTLAMKGVYLDDSFKIEEGRFHYYSPEGQLTSDIYFLHSKKNGLVKGYSNGVLTDSSFYKDDIPSRFSYGFYNDGKLYEKDFFDNDGNGIGEETVFYANGNLSLHGKYSKGYVKDSIWTYFYENGKPSCAESFDKGTLLKRECFDINGQSIGKCDTEVMPQPSVDIATFVSKNLTFPEGFNLTHDSAKVIARFVIDENGNIDDITIIHKLHPAFDSAVVELLKKMPKWKPGYYYNRPVKVYFNLPIRFKQTG